MTSSKSTTPKLQRAKGSSSPYKRGPALSTLVGKSTSSDRYVKSLMARISLESRRHAHAIEKNQQRPLRVHRAPRVLNYMHDISTSDLREIWSPGMLQENDTIRPPDQQIRILLNHSL